MKIRFNKDTSYRWTENEEYNRIVIEMTVAHMEDIFNYRGYVYLERIYEAFGLTWDPHMFNKAFIKEQDDNELVFVTYDIDNAGFDILFAVI